MEKSSQKSSQERNKGKTVVVTKSSTQQQQAAIFQLCNMDSAKDAIAEFMKSFKKEPTVWATNKTTAIQTWAMKSDATIDRNKVKIRALTKEDRKKFKLDPNAQGFVIEGLTMEQVKDYFKKQGLKLKSVKEVGNAPPFAKKQNGTTSTTRDNMSINNQDHDLSNESHNSASI